MHKCIKNQIIGFVAFNCLLEVCILSLPHLFLSSSATSSSVSLLYSYIYIDTYTVTIILLAPIIMVIIFHWLLAYFSRQIALGFFYAFLTCVICISLLLVLPVVLLSI